MNRQNIKIPIFQIHVMNSKQSSYLFVCLCFYMYHLSDNFYVNFRIIMELYINMHEKYFDNFYTVLDIAGEDPPVPDKDSIL